MSVELRPIRRSDTPALAGLLGQLGYPATEADVHERLDYWLDDPANRLIAATDDGELGYTDTCPAKARFFEDLAVVQRRMNGGAEQR